MATRTEETLDQVLDQLRSVTIERDIAEHRLSCALLALQHAHIDAVAGHLQDRWASEGYRVGTVWSQSAYVHSRYGADLRELGLRAARMMRDTDTAERIRDLCAAAADARPVAVTWHEHDQYPCLPAGGGR